MDNTKFNITLKELKAAVRFAEESGESDHKIITLTIDKSNRLDDRILVFSKWDGSLEDITDYGTW